MPSRTQNMVSVPIWKNRSNAEIAFHITTKTWFGQLRNLSDAAVSSWIGHILNPWVPLNGISAEWFAPIYQCHGMLSVLRWQLIRSCSLKIGDWGWNWAIHKVLNVCCVIQRKRAMITFFFKCQFSSEVWNVICAWLVHDFIYRWGLIGLRLCIDLTLEVPAES